MSEQPLLRATGIKKSYFTSGRRVDVLRGVDLSIAAGEMVAIVGSSGVGKSTLMHLLGTLDVPDEGVVTIDGRDVSGLDSNERTRLRNVLIGFVFQFHHLLPEFTAQENVAMPLFIGRENPTAAMAQAAELLGEFGLSERVTHRPSQLSGGEQQRVAVARALAANPKLVLADEPTGNLDTRTSAALVDMFKEIHARRGLTSVIVTHSEAVSQACDRVLYMEDGILAG